MSGLLKRGHGGRPKSPWTEPLDVTVSPEMVTALDELSTLTGAARTALIRLAIHDFLVRAAALPDETPDGLITLTTKSTPTRVRAARMH